MNRPDIRLLPAAGAAWCAGWWVTASSPGRAVLVAVGLACAGVLLLRTRGSRPVALAAALACAAGIAVLSSAAGILVIRGAGPFPQWVTERAVAQLHGRLVTDPKQAAAGRWGGPPRYVLRLDVSEAAARGRRAVVHAQVLLVGGEQWARLAAGAQVEVTGRLGPAEPGDDVVAVASALGGPAATTPGPWWWRAADHVRAGLRQSVAGLPQDAAGLLPSLVVGDTSTLQPAVDADLRASGLTHLTAVSGANVAIVVGSLLWVAVVMGFRRGPRLALAGVGLAAFVVLARPEPSVLRAAAMGAVALFGLTAGRRPRGTPALAAAVVVLLVADPWLARSPGFALSSVATGALLLLAPPWAARLERWLPRPVALALAAPAAAQAVCGPIVVLLNPTVSLVAVPANLLAEPAVAPATVLGVVAALLSTVWPWGAHAVSALAFLATWWITQVAAHAARLPFASLPWLPGPFGAAVLALLTAVAVVLSTRVASGRPPRGATSAADRTRTAQRPARSARAVATWATTGAALAVALLAGWFWWPRLGSADRSGEKAPGWVVAMCDVGQGDALAVRSGADRAVLVDAGPEPALVDGCLRRLGVRHLDLVVLTHFHADHVLGLPGALHGRDAAALVVSPLAQPQENARQVQRWAGSSAGPQGAAVPEVTAVPGTWGETGSDGWQVRWRLLLAGDSTSDPPDAGGGSEEGSVVNESSVATLLDVRGPDGRVVRVVGLGDLEVPGQEQLESVLSGESALLAERPVDVVKVAHHGSAKQDGDLYRRLAPRLALVGVGAGNDYGHPAPSTLTLLAAQRIPTYRTDTQGTVEVSVGADDALAVTTSR